jgi:hypothetical protein
MDEKTRQQVREAIADHDAAHPYWRQERRDREIKEAEERAQRAKEIHRQVEQQRQQHVANNSKAWCDWVDQRIAAALETHTFNGTQSNVLGRVIAEMRREWRKEIKSAIEEAKFAVETKLATKLEALEQRVERCSGRTDALGQAIETERAQRHKEIDLAFDAVQHGLDAKLETKSAAFEAHLKSLLPAKLPIATAYCADSVHYAGQVVAHCGSAYQAVRDTARAPPHVDDWVCLASGGRDAVTPTVRGTFDAREQYRELDIVVFDGATWIARRDNPGICPGDNWQLMAKQGRRGRPGIPGERGARGEKGDTGDPGRSLVSWQVDRAKYRASPLWSDGAVGPNLELHGLYEQYQDDTDDR